ncbi:unnamed protein product [Ranitomeya imitator]|uniref:Uncharacterized protein n=1 Tax=Ranitomeya imitator TaxID=111125 RepID=A0ABN9MBI2_9NEOB|nr:unnamed protein product [Ranitomeya imitator]
MVSLLCRGRLWWSVAAGTRHWGNWAAESRNKPLKQWTLIVHPLSSLRVKLPCNVRVRPQDPLTYPDADRVFVMVSGVDRSVHRGLDLDNIEVRYDEESRQVLVSSRDIDGQTCVEVTTPRALRAVMQFKFRVFKFACFGAAVCCPFYLTIYELATLGSAPVHTQSMFGCADVNIKTMGYGSVNIKKIECDNCEIETENGSSVLHSVKGHNVHIRTKGGKVVCLGTVHGNVDIRALAHSVSIFTSHMNGLDYSLV